MTRGRLLAVSAAAACLGLALLLGLAGLDALRWRGQLERGDVAFAAAPVPPRSWAAETRLPAGLTRSLLGVGDDLSFREAVRRFGLATPWQPARSPHDLALRSEAEAALARIERGGGDRAQRAHAALLRGILSFEEARADSQQAGVLLRRALVEFRVAARLAPADEDAKADVELVLRLLQEASDSASAGGGGERPNVVASGAGAATSGSGY